MAAVASQSGGKLELRDGLLEIATQGGTGYPGIRVKGSWNLSACNRLTLELANRDRKGELPITVRLDNPDADAGKSQGVFVDRVKIHGRNPTGYTVALPPPLPYAREINSKLSGMKRGPFATTGVAADLEEAGKAYDQANPEAQKPAVEPPAGPAPHPYHAAGRLHHLWSGHGRRLPSAALRRAHQRGL